jgi:hypothetical protein
MQFIEKNLLTTRYIISSVNLFLESKNFQAIFQPDMSWEDKTSSTGTKSSK